jgi:cytoskeletal protein CcmA (bactofilin family)
MPSVRRLVVVAVALAALLAVSTVGVVLAQGGLLGGKLLTGSNVTIPSGETIDHDLYVFGGTVASSATINGDLVVAGGNVDINGPVKGDVLVTGGRISINGAVTGDLRTAGGQVTINGDVTEDVLAAAGQVTINGRVGQDLIVGTGQLTVTGTVAGGAAGSAGTYTKSGTISGADSITVTGNDSRPVTVSRPNPVLDAIRHFLTVLAVALLALWLAPRLLRAAEAEVRTRPLPALGWGVVAIIAFIVALIAIVIVMILLAVVLGALGFGALVGIDIFGGIVLIAAFVLTFIVAAAFLVDAIVGLALARFVAGRSAGFATAVERSSARVSDRWSDLGLIVVGVAVVVLLTSLPVIGGWIGFVVLLLGLGALWLARRSGPRVVAATGTRDATAPAPR